jgi:hypothetical protein
MLDTCACMEPCVGHNRRKYKKLGEWSPCLCR